MKAWGSKSTSSVISLAHPKRTEKTEAVWDYHAWILLADLNIFFSKTDMTDNIFVHNTRLQAYHSLMKPGMLIIHNHLLVNTMIRKGRSSRRIQAFRTGLRLYDIPEDLLVTWYLSFPLKKTPQM